MSWKTLHHTLHCSVAFALTVLASGCASYYNHYAVFPAENSAGELRQVRLSWQSAEYPGWWLADNKATAITVETQCSQRVWKLVDGGYSGHASCGSGIRACGQEGVDLVAATGAAADANVVCMALNPDQPDARIADLGGKLTLLVSCRPARTSRGGGDEAENLDYVRASSVPYTVNPRKSPRGSLSSRPPALDESVCGDE